MPDLRRRAAQQGEAIGIGTHTKQPSKAWLFSTTCTGTEARPRDATGLQLKDNALLGWKKAGRLPLSSATVVIAILPQCKCNTIELGKGNECTSSLAYQLCETTKQIYVHVLL